MKKMFLLVAFMATAMVQTGFAQNNHAAVHTPALLTAYYDVKDALVAGDAALAASKAGQLVKAINSTDAQILPKASKDSLLADAAKIAGDKDLKNQRACFSGLSNQMIALVKTTKLSAEPIYQQYCPMKKSSWLSNEKAIKNPYYGNAMLTCGKVTETIM
jgi:hypothetical protein